MRNRHSKGFTIIELLVAIAIIGILASTLFVYLDTARAKSRDARRLSDMNEISKAINLYYATHQRYPVAASEITIDSNDALSLTLEADGVISNTPRDPLYPTYEYRYVTDATGANFTLTFCMETTSNQRFVQGCTNTMSP